AGDKRVRDTHRGMNHQTVGQNESFVSPSGARLRYPGDPLAPAAEIINCRCWTENSIDFMKGLI
ncbi:MAG: putative head morphosis protein, partial [Novosphingobium sp.]|nr:putative head morphosis protein [Novosphingobium sp.]